MVQPGIDLIKGYNIVEITTAIIDYLNVALEFEDARVSGIYLVGSRVAGTQHENSDLDVVVEYEGDAREDDLFNQLNDEDRLVVGDIPIDFNPIKAEKSGTFTETVGGRPYIKIYQQ